jgi:hypothetical protein
VLGPLNPGMTFAQSIEGTAACEHRYHVDWSDHEGLRPMGNTHNLQSAWSRNFERACSLALGPRTECSLRSLVAQVSGPACSSGWFHELTPWARAR